jgi:hypothetical protein
MTDPFHVDSHQNYDSSVEEKENYIDIKSRTSLKVQFPRMPYTEFWVSIGGEFPHFSRKTKSILLPGATSYLCGFSAVAAIRTEYPSDEPGKRPSSGHFKTPTSVL